MQQINLYLEEFKPKKEWATLENGLIVVLIMLLLIGIEVAFKQASVKEESQKVVALDTELASLTASVESLKTKPNTIPTHALEEKIKQARANIEQRQRMTEWFKTQSFGNQTGFSRPLMALGQHLVPGVFLQEFGLQQGGEYVWMKGISERTEDVPLYVSRLQQDEQFKSSKFGRMVIVKKTPHHQFSLSGSTEGLKNDAKTMETF
jgi:Tfp pilus assembly protein PilN